MTGDEDHFQSILAALADPAAYPPPQPAEVEVIETHISAVFLAGPRAYKVKKPLHLPFLDFSTLAAREHFCHEEVRLNAELAPGVYRGVVPVRRDGQTLRLAGRGELFEWAVEMERLPAQGMLDVLLDRGEIDNELLRQIAATLTRFHARAATGPGVDEHGTLEAVRALVEENFAETDRFVATGSLHALGRRVHDLVEAWALHFLHERSELFAQRMRSGRVRDGHGDLHAGNVCRRGPDGSLVIYDRLEFSPRFRCADVAADLAFLLMDLDHRGFRGFSDYLLREYAARSEDVGMLELVDFYKCYRAWVRGKVTALRAAQTRGSARETTRLAAMRYFNLAAGYTLPESIVLLCGLPGSGKTWVARQLAAAVDCTVLNSDATRKQQAAIGLDEHHPAPYGGGIYDAEHTEATYAALLAAAQPSLAKGRSVVLDAGYRTPAQRAPIVDLAHALRVPIVVVLRDPPEAVVRERLTARAREGKDVSDAGIEVYERCKAEFVPPTVGEGAPVLVSREAEAGPELVAEVLGALLAQAEPAPSADDT
jgi:aminoglycoside phosphotransferase family enzyme/predicted kinase